MKSWKRPAAALGVVLVAVLGYFLIPPSVDIDPAPYLKRASRYQVEIVRDAYGVPHVLGKTDADAAFGLAYAHAEDDAETIRQVIMAVRGRLASVQGPEAGPTDYLVALMGIWPTVEAGYPQLPEDVRALAEGYADGLNTYFAKHPDRALPGLVPVRGQDVVAGFVFKTPLFYGLDQVLRATFQGEMRKPDAFAPKGSNGFALTSSRTADGHVRLIVNSHQPFKGPVAWYEAHMISEAGLNMAGALFPGAPLILHGHNANLGWASTVNRPDLADVFQLKLHPEDKRRYQLDGKWLPLEVTTARIKVRVFGRFYWTVQRDVVRSKHGPVIERPEGSYAIRFAGDGEFRQLTQYYRMNRAENFAQWREAMRMLALPSINFIYADREGNIGMFHNAKLPKRAPGLDYKKTVPGDRADLIWTDFHAFDALPHTVNPPSGMVYNANNTPFSATDGAGSPAPSAFGQETGIQRHMTNRALRVIEMFSKDRSITEAELLTYKFDKRYSSRSEVAKARQRLLESRFEDELAQKAQKLLASWDLDTSAENRGAALGVLTFSPMIVAKMKGTPPPELKRQFVVVAHHLQDNFGKLDVTWGEVSRLRRGGVDLPLGGAPDVLRAIYSEDADDGRSLAMSGDSYIMLVDWSPQGKVRSRSVHQYGAATKSTTSPHYADQAPLFAKQKFKAVHFERAQVEQHASARYKPTEPKGR